MTDDRDIPIAEVQTLVTRDGVAAFFATLGYRTDRPADPDRRRRWASLPGHCRARSSTSNAVAMHDDGAEPLDLYLIELTSVTVAATQALARSLRNRAGNHLLVLTDDYERLDFRAPGAFSSGFHEPLL